MMYRFLDYELHDGRLSSLTEKILAKIKNNESLAVNFSAAHTFVCCNENPKLKEIVLNGLIVEDGKPLEKYLRVFYENFQRIRAADYMRYLLSLDNELLRHFFLGGRDDYSSEITSRVKKVYPHAKISGQYSPPFSDDICELVDRSLEEIKKTDANVVWVGLGAPKQFLVSDALARKYPGIFLSVGAGFDYLSGAQKESPQIFQHFGLEWLYRLASSPKRLFKRYTIDNAKFLLLVFRDYVSR